jgi:hypothetical protein
MLLLLATCCSGKQEATEAAQATAAVMARDGYERKNHQVMMMGRH